MHTPLPILFKEKCLAHTNAEWLRILQVFHLRGVLRATHWTLNVATIFCAFATLSHYCSFFVSCVVLEGEHLFI